MSIEISDELVERVAAACLERSFSQLRNAQLTFAGREWLCPGEAGQYLHLTEKALEHLRADKTGPRYHKYSGRIRYHINDLRLWAMSHAEGGSQ